MSLLCHWELSFLWLPGTPCSPQVLNWRGWGGKAEPASSWEDEYLVFWGRVFLTLKMFLSSQGIAIASLFLGSSQIPSYFFLIFFSLNNNITVYFWNTDLNTSVVLFLFTLLSVLLCCWYFYANTSAVFLIFSISLWKRQLKLSVAIFMLVSLLQAASPFCVVIILAD